MDKQNMHKNNMRMLRISADRTQKEAANSSHISLKMWQLYEYGKTIPPLDKAKAIALALDAKVEDVFPKIFQ